MNNLVKYGANERFFAEAELYPDLLLARVLSQHRNLYKIITEHGEAFAEISGKLRYETHSQSDYPTVGDFVMSSHNENLSGHAIIHHVLNRKSVFERTAVGADNQIQVVAANIDIVFICMSLNKDYNLSRLERYLSVAWSSQALPVIVLTKADLCEDLSHIVSEISTIAFDVDIVTTSRFDQVSHSKLRSYLKQGVTASFIGSSGVGKSTLINQLIGKELLNTSTTGHDDKGRHTTTHRELLLLPQGGIVIDTPGMREIGALSADVSKPFADIETLISQCRFRDCTHTTEPGCSIREALETGTLDERRLANYQKLKRETRYHGLSSKQIETEKLNNMFKNIGGMKKARDYLRKNNKRR